MYYDVEWIYEFNPSRNTNTIFSTLRRLYTLYPIQNIFPRRNKFSKYIFRKKVPDQHWQQAGPGLDLKQVGGEQARTGQGRFSTLRLVPAILLFQRNNICIVHYLEFNAKKRLYSKTSCLTRTFCFTKLLISHHFQERPDELPNE